MIPSFLNLLLHAGNAVAVSFTAAFVRAKVEEIVSQLSRCFNCSCSPSGPLCTPSSFCQDDSAGTYVHKLQVCFFVFVTGCWRVHYNYRLTPIIHKVSQLSPELVHINTHAHMLPIEGMNKDTAVFPCTVS